MKKTISMILATLLIAASLASCGGSNEENTTEGNKININTEQTTEKNDSNITEDNTTEKTEENSSEVETDKGVNKNSNPGEYTYVERNDTIFVMTPGNVLAIRDADYGYIAEVNNGTPLRRVAISEDGRWSKVIVAGVEGYVATRNTTTYNPDDNGFTESVITLTTAVTLNVRIYPAMPEGADNSETSCNLAGYIVEGTVVNVLAYDEENNWYKISYTPAEGILSGDYEYEFFIKANNSYFVETKEEETTEEQTTEAPAPEVVIPDGYKEVSAWGVSFAVPENYSISTGSSFSMIMGGSTMISVKKDTFSDSYKNDFVTSLGLNVASTEVTEATCGDYKVYIVSCVTNPEASSASYDTLVCVVTGEAECVEITVTQMGSKTDIVDVIVDTLIVKG